MSGAPDTIATYSKALQWQPVGPLDENGKGILVSLMYGDLAQSFISSITLSVIRLLVSLETEAPVDLGEMRRDLAGGRAFGIQRQHHLIHTGQPPLAL